MTNKLEPQKALHLHEAKKVRKFSFGEYMVFEKLDGWYCYIDCVDGKWDVLRSRAMREISSLNHLSEMFHAIPQTTSIRAIFEVVIPGVPFHVANGILNRKKELAKEAILYLHDVMELDSFACPFHIRHKGCELSMSALNKYLGDKVQLAPVLATHCTSESFARQLFEKVVNSGGEGIILKELNAGYHFGKRNSTLLKIKEEVTKDLLVVDIVEGEGKYLEHVGALVVVNKLGIRMQVSGMSDSQRRQWWLHPEDIIGCVVEVKAMKELPDGNLREPRFKAVRFDKTKEEID